MVAELCELEAKLAEVEERDRKAAWEEFVKAVWANRSAADLLKLVNAAGMKASDGDKLIVMIRKGQADVHLADQWQRLRREEAELKSAYEKVRDRNEAEISRLREEIRRASFKHDQAIEATCAAYHAVDDLVQLYDKGLMPTPHKEVTRWLERRAAEEKSNAAHEVLSQAENWRNRLWAIIRDIEEQIERLPLSVTLQRDKANLNEKLEMARRDLVEAEEKVKVALVAAERAKKAIPPQ